jgi:hypothetical protein
MTSLKLSETCQRIFPLRNFPLRNFFLLLLPTSSCPKHFIQIVRLPLTTMLVTSSPLSLILTLTLVRPESFLCLL